MQYKEAVSLIKEFFRSEVITKYYSDIEITEPFDENTPEISKQNVNLPKDGIGHKSGLYFIYSLSGEIYYIGKATVDNLHEEVWGKIKTPSKHNENTSYYPKNYFLNKNLDKEAVEDVTTGNVKIGVLTISDKKLSSLAEVYLQTIFQNNSDELPKLNSRIG